MSREADMIETFVRGLEVSSGRHSSAGGRSDLPMGGGGGYGTPASCYRCNKCVQCCSCCCSYYYCFSYCCFYYCSCYSPPLGPATMPASAQNTRVCGAPWAPWGAGRGASSNQYTNTQTNTQIPHHTPVHPGAPQIPLPWQGD